MHEVLRLSHQLLQSTFTFSSSFVECCQNRFALLQSERLEERIALRARLRIVNTDAQDQRLYFRGEVDAEDFDYVSWTTLQAVNLGRIPFQFCFEKAHLLFRRSFAKNPLDHLGGQPMGNAVVKFFKTLPTHFLIGV